MECICLIMAYNGIFIWASRSITFEVSYFLGLLLAGLLFMSSVKSALISLLNLKDDWVGRHIIIRPCQGFKDIWKTQICKFWLLWRCATGSTTSQEINSFWDRWEASLNPTEFSTGHSYLDWRNLQDQHFQTSAKHFGPNSYRCCTSSWLPIMLIL